MKTRRLATFYAVLAAALYAINIPVSKVLLTAAGVWKQLYPDAQHQFLFKTQKNLGAAKTSAYDSIAPFLEGTTRMLNEKAAGCEKPVLFV